MTGPAIFFHADAIEGEGKDLVGRRAAGQSFLQGFLRHVPGDVVHAVSQTAAGKAQFAEVAAALGETRPVDVTPLRGNDNFTTKGSIFFPGPGFLDAPWRRQRFGPERCSLVGITHTVSTRRVIEGMHRLMLEPVEDWDAIICTSRAVHSVVAQQMEMETAYIQRRFAAGRVPMPQLPVIPLGINAQDFAQDAAAGQALRQRFGVPKDAIVVMTVGRLTSVEKANPAPLYLALEEVAQSTGQALHLWQVGWSNRDTETELHDKGATALAPSVTVTRIDGRAPDIRRHIWSGADIFTLPVDNIQETFGLVPVEAMAAGLPVVMPDWDGFRDTVRHGETGFLIPTRMPDPGQPLGRRLAERFADGTDDYLRHLSLIQQQTQIDLRAYVNALSALVRQPDLRQRMGQAGRAHVAAHFDWSQIIPQYLDLHTELTARRAGAKPTTAGFAKRPINPLEIDPFTLYQGYPSAHLKPTDVIAARRPLDEAVLTALDAVNGRTLYRRKVMPDTQILALAQQITQTGPLDFAALEKICDLGTDNLQAAVLFLAKYDFVTITPQQPK